MTWWHNKSPYRKSHGDNLISRTIGCKVQYSNVQRAHNQYAQLQFVTKGAWNKCGHSETHKYPKHNNTLVSHNCSSNCKLLNACTKCASHIGLGDWKSLCRLFLCAMVISHLCCEGSCNNLKLLTHYANIDETRQYNLCSYVKSLTVMCVQMHVWITGYDFMFRPI